MATYDVNGTTRIVVQATGALAAAKPFVYPSAGSQDQVWVEYLDQNLLARGMLQFVSISANLYYNSVGSWTMAVPYSDALWNQIMAGDFFVLVHWRGLFTFGGKCEQPGYSDSVPGSPTGQTISGHSGPFVTLTGADYLALLANRIAYPNPTVAWASQTAAATDAVSNMPLESAIKHYVSRNAGSSAIAARRISQMDIAPDLGRGANVSYTVKFGTGVNLNLMDICRALIGQSGSKMGMSLTRNPSTNRLTFDVYIPRDLSKKAWFSEALGNLASVQFYITDPTCTDALIQGSGTNFLTTNVTTGKTAWNIIETFVDSSTETDVNVLKTTGQTTVNDGQAGPSIAATAVDTPFLTYGRDYGLGDIVTVEVRPGASWTDMVSGVTLTADPSQDPQVSAVPTIGNSANATTNDQRILGSMLSRLRKLERKLATKLWLRMIRGLLSSLSLR
jgi:hypothetical protein